MTDNENSNHERFDRMVWEQTRKPGLVHLYTGNGKGKTTAALGLALRALGRERQVAIIQFLKRTSFKTGEMLFIEKLDGPLTIRRFGASRFASPEEHCEVEESGQTVALGWEIAQELVREGRHDLVVLDEITHVVKQGQVPLEEVIDLVNHKPSSMEMVLTGRYATEALMDVCDYVTEMKEIKHPFQSGVRAREGTEY